MNTILSSKIRRDGLYYHIIEITDKEFNFGFTHHIDAVALAEDETFVSLSSNFDKQILDKTFNGLANTLTFFSQAVIECQEYSTTHGPYSISFSLTALTATYTDDFVQTNIVCTLFENGQLQVDYLTKHFNDEIIRKERSYLFTFIANEKIKHNLTPKYVENLIPKIVKKSFWSRF